MDEQDEEGEDDVRVQRDNPLCSAVFCKKAEFDSKGTDLLIVHVQGAGPGSVVEPPVRVSPTEVRIPVRRSNMKTFISQMVPAGVPPERLLQFEQEVSMTLKDAFGNHTDLQLLDNAFRALVPEQEKWFVEVTVKDPYKFKKIKKSRTFCHPNGIDVLSVLPLETETEEKNQAAPVISLSMPQIAASNNDKQ